MYYQIDELNTKNKIDILPMIDIIFAILSFLIISSLYLTRVDTIPVDLPKASTAIKQDKKFINVSINKLGDIFINKEIILLEDLTETISPLVTASNNLVVLHADKNVSHGVFIDVLDSLRSFNGLKLAVSTQPLN
tara:strand:+ start:5054 stop:5458 length:405 start_codon:yes stop_codon:yes gene_type:complete